MSSHPRSAGWLAFIRLSAAVARHETVTSTTTDTDRDLYAELQAIRRDIAPPAPIKLDSIGIVRPDRSDDDLPLYHGHRPSTDADDTDDIVVF
jgi:hypothetical protein